MQIDWERERQVSAEHFTPEHDDKHCRGELALAALTYWHTAKHGLPYVVGLAALDWPKDWHLSMYRPFVQAESGKIDRQRCLVKAGALALAEIARLSRFIDACGAELDEMQKSEKLTQKVDEKLTQKVDEKSTQKVDEKSTQKVDEKSTEKHLPKLPAAFSGMLQDVCACCGWPIALLFPDANGSAGWRHIYPDGTYEHLCLRTRNDYKTTAEPARPATAKKVSARVLSTKPASEEMPKGVPQAVGAEQVQMKSVYVQGDDKLWHLVASFRLDQLPDAPSDWPEEIAEWMTSHSGARVIVTPPSKDTVHVLK
jgi:hypothetical protein